MHKTRRRFQGYDYARGGALFVTTCLEPRRPLFGSVDHERVALSEAGEIGNNPLKWWLMHGDRSLMHVMEPFPLPEAGDSDLWRAVGNDALLESPRIVSLRISRKVSESALQQVVAVCRRGAREKGYVYISTFFSPGERMVFKALAEEEAVPMIRLAPTFMELAYRPHGQEPLLFAKKRLLVLSRMRDPAEPPRRDELLGLNFVAAAVARGSGGGRTVYVTAPRGGGNQVEPRGGGNQVGPRGGGNQVGRGGVVYGEHPTTM